MRPYPWVLLLMAAMLAACTSTPQRPERGEFVAREVSVGGRTHRYQVFVPSRRAAPGKPPVLLRTRVRVSQAGNQVAGERMVENAEGHGPIMLERPDRGGADEFRFEKPVCQRHKPVVGDGFDLSDRFFDGDFASVVELVSAVSHHP